MNTRLIKKCIGCFPMHNNFLIALSLKIKSIHKIKYEEVDSNRHVSGQLKCGFTVKFWKLQKIFANGQKGV